MSSKQLSRTLWIRRFACYSLILSLSLTAMGNDTESSQFSVNMDIEGVPLKRIGSGVREFLFFDIYAMGAYSQSGSCLPSDIVYKDEFKYLKLVMIRELSKDRLVSTLRKTLSENLPQRPAPETPRNIDQFLSQFKKDLPEGSVVEILYQPGKGTLAKQDGRKLGPSTTGKEFAETLWRSYFGDNSCCSGLKSSILKQCSAKK